jgi:peptidoglycan hydrolase-like protein with peptidoglycan-binding domain
VRSVRLLVKGATPLGLFPGYVATRAITAKDARAPDVPPPAQPAPEPPTDPSQGVRELQQRLADLSYLPAEAVDGRDGERTRFAVLAFQKWQGLGRDGVAGPVTRAALARATRPTPRTSGGGNRFEVLLDRQLALYIESGTVVRTLHVSTGAPGFETPAGVYSVFRKEQQSWSVPYKVWLPWASYFVGGVAFHQAPDIPPQAASHGCVRVPRYDSKWVYDHAPNGTVVTVLRSST